MSETSKEVLKKINIDSNRRISVGKLVPEYVTGFTVVEQENGRLLLEPTVDIPAREHWLFQNPKALASVKKGLLQAAKGKVSKLKMSDLDEDDEV